MTDSIFDVQTALEDLKAGKDLGGRDGKLTPSLSGVRRHNELS